MQQGDFVRAKTDEGQYFYGVISYIDPRGNATVMNGGTLEIFGAKRIEVADPQPVWPEPKRRVIKDRKKLVRILLDMGYEPDEDGAFRKSGDLSFSAKMWGYCGKEVRVIGNGKEYSPTHGPYHFLPEWTEETPA